MVPALKALAPQVYTSTFPGCPSPVTTRLSVIDDLQAVLRSTSEDQQGILFGQATSLGTEVLSSRPLATFTAGEIAAALGKTGDPAVGYYRIRKGASLELSPEEIEIAGELFSKPGSVILLIERREGETEGCFFFQENGVLLNYPLLRFPVDSAELARREAQRLFRAEEKGPKPSPSAEELPAPDPMPPMPATARLDGVAANPQPAAQSTAGSARARWRNVALILGGAAAGFFVFLLLDDVELRRVAPSAPPETVVAAPGTPLKAERQGADLKVTWDLSSPAIAGATSGLLNIDDGGVKRQLALSAEQVRLGGLLYSPNSDHVSVRLTTLKENQSTSDSSVLVLLNREVPAALPPSTPLENSRPPSDNRNQAKAPVARSTAPTADTDRTSSRLVSETVSEAKAQARSFVPPPSAARKSVSVTPQDLPAVPAALPHVDVPVLPLASASLPAAPPRPPEPSNAAPQLAPAIPNRPAERPNVAPHLTPAVLTYDPGVTVPPELKQLVNAPVDVRVRVTVDAAGRVTHAEAVRQEHVHALLLSAATSAALRCRFRPARLGDTPVASEVTILFQVRP